MSSEERRLRAMQVSRREVLVDPTGETGKLWAPGGRPQLEREVPGTWVEPPVALEPMVEDGLRQRHRQMAGHHGVNVYKCEACGQLTVTLDHDNGVTPMFLGCRTTRDCGGRGVSSGYPPGEPPARILDALAWTWYRPGPTELAWLRANEPGMADHVLRGGLALRPWRDGDNSAYRRPYPPPA